MIEKNVVSQFKNWIKGVWLAVLGKRIYWGDWEGQKGPYGSGDTKAMNVDLPKQCD